MITIDLTEKEAITVLGALDVFGETALHCLSPVHQHALRLAYRKILAGIRPDHPALRDTEAAPDEYL